VARSPGLGSRGIRVEIDDGKLSVVARRDFGNALRGILKKIEREAKVLTSKEANHPYSRTGNLRRSITAGAIKAVNQYAIRGSVDAGGPIAPYAKFVHEGTRRHIIRARPDNPTGLLRFMWVNRGTYTRTELRQVHLSSGEGRRGSMQTAAFDVQRPYAPRLVVTPLVNHPGNRPKPFLVVAARRVVGPVDVRRR
jgi:hypothetical protein